MDFSSSNLISVLVNIDVNKFWVYLKNKNKRGGAFLKQGLERHYLWHGVNNRLQTLIDKKNCSSSFFENSGLPTNH